MQASWEQRPKTRPGFLLRTDIFLNRENAKTSHQWDLQQKIIIVPIKIKFKIIFILI